MTTLKSDNLEYYLSLLPPKVLIIIGSPTCNMCKLEVPKIEKQLGDKIEILYINGEKWDKIADKYNVQFYPTLLLLENGLVIDRIDNVRKRSFKTLIN